MAQTSFYSKNYVGWPPTPLSEYTNPESGYWYGLAQGAKKRLDDRLGIEASDEWFTQNVDTTGTWEAIYRTMEAHLEAIGKVQA